MTRDEAKKILEAYIACESKKAHFECSEYNCDDNCPLLYGMGTVGEYNEAINMAIKALEYDDAKYHAEHGEVIVDNAVWEDAKRAVEQEPSGDAVSRKVFEQVIWERDVAIAELKELGYRFGEKPPMGIWKVIEQEPCDVFDKYGNYKYPGDVELTEPNTVTSMPCEDAISRQDAIKAIDEKAKRIKNADTLNGLAGAVGILFDLPSVKPQEKTGSWIILDECSNSGYYCSECHKKVVKEGWSATVKKIKFCPNCGAQMN